MNYLKILPVCEKVSKNKSTEIGIINENVMIDIFPLEFWLYALLF